MDRGELVIGSVISVHLSMSDKVIHDSQSSVSRIYGAQKRRRTSYSEPIPIPVLADKITCHFLIHLCNDLQLQAHTLVGLDRALEIRLDLLELGEHRFRNESVESLFMESA